jgi:preprotein translocase subunit SecD
MHTDSHRCFVRPTYLLLNVGILVLTAFAEVPTSQPSSTHHLRFSLVAEEGEPGDSDSLSNPDDGGKQVKVFKEAVLDGRHVSEAKIILDDQQQNAVSIRLTDAGGKIFHQFTADHLHRRLAVVVDGELVECATIQTIISKEMIVTNQGGFTKDAADKLIHNIRGAMQDASTRPADRQ